MMADTTSLAVWPYFLAMKPEMVNCPEAYRRLAMNRPNSRKPMAAEITDHDAASPTLKASCEVPMVDLAPMYSDISSTATTTAGIERPATMNCSELRLRSRMLATLVTTI